MNNPVKILSILFSALCLIKAYNVAADEIRSNDVSSTTTSESEEQSYGVIMDCGSSGTRVHIYQWDTKMKYPDLLHAIEPMTDSNQQPVTIKINPGLSSFANEMQKVPEYIDQLLQFIVSKIPEDRFKYTGIYVLATAGMRLLDDDTQEEIMTEVKKHINSRFKFGTVATSVIPGSQEGMFQWISVNSKAKRFLDANIDPKSPTYAVIEMGGASIQITYQLRQGLMEMPMYYLSRNEEALEAFYEQIVEPAISRKEDEHNFRLVSVTFLGFGSESARSAYVDYLVRKQSKTWLLRWSDKVFNTHFTHPAFSKTKMQKVLSLKDPCLPRRANETMMKPIKMLEDSTKSLGFSIDDDDETFAVKLTGTGDYATCKKYLEKVLARAKEEKMNCKEGEVCTMSLVGTSFVPYHRFEFLGVSDFYYTASAMEDVSGTYDKNKFIQKSKKICKTSYDTLLKNYPEANMRDNKRVMIECFKSVWMEVFLSSGINMPDNFWKFRTVGKINGQDLEWTLGAVLDKASALA